MIDAAFVSLGSKRTCGGQQRVPYAGMRTKFPEEEPPLKIAHIGDPSVVMPRMFPKPVTLKDRTKIGRWLHLAFICWHCDTSS